MRRSSAVSTNAEKFSTFPCPYWWSASAGLSETPTEKNVSSEAIRSRPECAASERIPRLPVLNPTTTLSVVMTTAARTEPPAAASSWMVIWRGFPTCRNYRRLERKAPTKLGHHPGSLANRKRLRAAFLREPAREKKSTLVLGFDAWHLRLSEGPILEEMSYA